MIRADVLVEIAPLCLGIEEGYECLSRLLGALVVVQAGSWFVVEGKAVTPFKNRSEISSIVKSKIEMCREKFPNAKNLHGFALTVTTAHDKKTWEAPGRLTVKFAPDLGFINVEFYKPEQAFGLQRPVRMIRDTLLALVEQEGVIFGQVNVVERHPQSLLKDYKNDYAVFPHRKYIGWMGFVTSEITPGQLPLAASVEPIRGKGTLIVSVAETFDLNNPEHIKRANQVEIALVDLDLLPVTDPSLL